LDQPVPLPHRERLTLSPLLPTSANDSNASAREAGRRANAPARERGPFSAGSSIDWLEGLHEAIFMTPPKSSRVRPFNAQAFLESSGIAKTVVEYGRGAPIFTQGDHCEHVLYIQTGGVKLSVLSKSGREAVV